MKLSDDQRARWADSLRQRPPAEGCPGDETIWSAIAGELDEAMTRQIVDHLSRCGPCSTSWQLAREMHNGLRQKAQGDSVSGSVPFAAKTPASRPAEAPSRGVHPWVPRAMAIAAALLLAFVAYPVLREMLDTPSLDPSFRTMDASAIAALDSEEIPLPRDAFVLRWQGSPEGSLYSVTLSDAMGTMSWTVRGLEESELLVPEERLADLESGTQLLWQVEATLPDGQKQESLTFVHTLE